MRRLVAPNASPFTFNGTCTYIVGKGAGRDGRSGPGGRCASGGASRCGRRARRSRRSSSPTPIATTALARTKLARRPARGWSARRRSRRPAMGLAGLEFRPRSRLCARRGPGRRRALQGAGYSIEAIATPGHCSNHLCFALIEDSALLSGDHVMAWSTSVVAPPDGSMRAYMASLEKLRGRAEAIYWPGHGGPVVEPQRYLRALIHHRRQREASILAALGDGPQTDSRAGRQGLRGDQSRARPRRGHVDPRASRRPRRARSDCRRRRRNGDETRFRLD